jgi:hypothetical protein
MNLYALDTPAKPYMYRTQSIDPMDNLPFSGGDYIDNEDLSRIISKLQFRLGRDVYEKKITSSFLYEAIDFYNGPLIVKNYSRYMLHFYTVSPKLKELLEQLTLPEHKFYSISLNIDEGVDLPYYIMQIKDNMTPYMDYNKSSFFSEYESGSIKSDNPIYYKEGEIKDEAHLLNLLGKGFSPNELKLYLDKELDWVYLAPYFIISEKSKQLFEDNDIVGMEFTSFYDVKPIVDEVNELGYKCKYGGREIIINGKSTMDGLDINDFPRADKE